MFKRKVIEEILDKIEKKENEGRVPKALVQVSFCDGFTLLYFSDLPEIEVGDVVTVEGKMENQLALVTDVLHSFKKPKFEMQWIASRIDSDISGAYFRVDDDVVSLDHTLTADKILGIYVGVKAQEDVAYGEDFLNLDLDNIESSDLFCDEQVKQRGRALYEGDAVRYVSLKDGVGKALVHSFSSDVWYEIDFRYKNGKMTYLACDCPYMGGCKHIYAFLLKFRELQKKFSKRNISGDFVACGKTCFHYVLTYARGKITLEQ